MRTKVLFFLLKPELSSCLFILFSCLVIFCFVAHRDDLSVITRGRDVIHQLHRNAVVTNNYNATNNKMNTSWRHAPLRRSRDNALNAFKVQTPHWWTTNKQLNNRISKSRISFLSLFSNPDSFQIQRVFTIWWLFLYKLIQPKNTQIAFFGHFLLRCWSLFSSFLFLFSCLRLWEHRLLAWQLFRPSGSLLLCVCVPPRDSDRFLCPLLVASL